MTDQRGERIVTDQATGLTWSDESAGTHSWEAAAAYCTDGLYGGYRDWRLPTAIELLSIVDFGAHDPPVNTSAFRASANEWCWTSTPYLAAGGVRSPWAVWFHAGATTSYGMGVTGGNYYNRVRCVRGAPGTTVGPSYVVADGSVFDPVSKLTWQQVVPPLQLTAVAADRYCSELTQNGASWRVPRIKELETLVDRSSSLGWIVTTRVFQVPAGIRPVFWTSTPDVSTQGLNRWRVGNEGSVLPSAADNSNSVICVH